MPALDEGENPELVDFRRRFLWTLPLSLLVFVLAMFGDAAGLLAPAARSLLELALTAPVVLWAGWPFFQRWAQSIANRSPNMWTLIGTGVGAAFGYSVVATAGARHCSRIPSACTAAWPCISKPPRSSSRSRCSARSSS
jgi:Cu+-exporting ATPase